MAMTTEEEIIIRERLVHIDQMLADNDRKRQESKIAPWQVAFAALTSGAALFAAGAAVMAALFLGCKSKLSLF
jgi:hypothetical protein